MATCPILLLRSPAATLPAASLYRKSLFPAQSAKWMSAEFCSTRRYHNCRSNSSTGSKFRGIHSPRSSSSSSSSGSASATMAEGAMTALKLDEGANENGSSTSTRQSVLQFAKYHGLGNDFLLVDNRESMTPKITSKQAIKLCDRNFGVGGDGVIFVLPGTDGSDYTMRIYNSDGSEPEMCGNGIRCMAKFVAELEGTTEARSYKISTLSGLIVPRLQDDGQVCVDMGSPILEASKIPTTLAPSKNGAVVKVPLSVDGKSWNVTCVSMGNPHCITILDDTEVLDDLPLSSIGPLFEHHEVFPARTNTEFIQVLSPSHIRMRVWERGAGATLACGTGACALVVAAVLEGRTERECLVELPGGPLQIEWREDDNHLYMTGPAQIVFTGAAIFLSNPIASSLHREFSVSNGIFHLILSATQIDPAKWPDGYRICLFCSHCAQEQRRTKRGVY